MGITRTSGRTKSGYKKHVSRCWECGEPSSVLVVHPATQKPLCQDCAGDAWHGFEAKKHAATPEAD